MRAALVATLLAFAALAPAAHAGDFNSGSTAIVFGVPGVRELGQAGAVATVSGAITVDFHGDPAAGCAQRGLCDVSGTVTWRPQRRGVLSAVRYRTPKRKVLLVSLYLIGAPGATTTTTAQTQRAGAGSACGDLVADEYGGIISGQSLSSSVRLGPGAPGPSAATDIFATRCPGPLLSDVAKLLPSVKVAFADVAKGERTLDLSAERMLSAAGLAGTVRSTLVVRLERGQTQKPTVPTRPRGRTVRRRELSAEFDMRLTGAAAIDLAGGADEARCAPLDACGAQGTLTLIPPSGSIEAYMTAEGPASLSAAKLRASIGLAGGPRPSGVRINGIGYGSRRLTTDAVLTRGGAPGCADRAPTSAPAVGFSIAGGRLTASLVGIQADLLHTRCGGPTFADVAGERFLARGSVPLTAMRAATVTIPLTEGRSFDAGAWHGRVRPALQIVLRREKVRTHVFREPAGLAGSGAG